MTTLVIVESPGKVKQITAALGSGYKVVASVGHVRDLPQKETGISPPDFKPAYEPTDRGKDILARLKKDVAAASAVILATDPDREGEAIAWHLADALNLTDPQRVTFSAITKDAISAAIAAPRKIDMDLVRAQEARRVLDRIVGYRVSPELSNRSGQALSAGRVQSVAVRLVVDRERVIQAFKATKHFGAELFFDNEDGTKWKAVWDTKPHLPAGETYILDEALAQRIAAIRTVTVGDFQDSEKGRAPAAPFTTSTLQQVAGKKLKFKPKRTMELAQRLYEQGAITYHRTDAPNMDEAGQLDIAEYARGAGLALADKPRKWKAKESAQEGHEAIRPTSAKVLEAGENADEKALYQLIWQRAIASQLADAVYAVRTVLLDAPDESPAVQFKASGRTLITPGWLTVYSEEADESEGKDDGDEESNNPIPALESDASIEASSGQLQAKTTRPPNRFTEPTLVAEMERLGIGRPSTYANILENITGRAYVTSDKKGYLIPSEVGASVRDALVTRFGFVELDYTRELEEQLDLIADGKAEYTPVIAAAWEALDSEIAKLADANMPVANPCPECGKALARRKGQYGFFWSCTGYPDCKVSMPDNKGKPGERKAPPPPTGIDCPDCGKELARRTGTTKPKTKGMKPRDYDFYSCTGYPTCESKFQTGADGKPVFPES